MSSDNTTELGKRVRALRESQNLTQKELASRLGVHQRDISSLETSPSFREPRLILAVAEYFNVPINELRGNTDSSSAKSITGLSSSGSPRAASPKSGHPTEATDPDASSRNPPTNLSASSAMEFGGATSSQPLSASSSDSEPHEQSKTSSNEDVTVIPEPASARASASVGPISMEATGTFTPPSKDKITGQGIYVTREASLESACLGAPAIARALATFFRSAQGEFFFAIFGAWGRGKSYLMRFIRKELDKWNYHTIYFSAWRFRKSPELWCHLYETVSQEIRDTSLLGSIGLRFRIGVTKNGFLRLFLLILSFAFAILPTAAITSEIAWIIMNLVGIAGCIMLFKLYRGSLSFLSDLHTHFLALKSHEHGLGIQGLVSRDILNLFTGWIPSEKERKSFLLGSYVMEGVCDGICLLLQLPYWLEIAGYNFKFPLPPWPLFASLLIIWWGISLMVARSLRSGFAPYHKVMVIVDDLDRCGADELLEIVESIKVVLDHPELHDRLQIVMLVEEEILKRAIAKKFEAFHQSAHRDPIPNAQLDRMIKEHVEKLFLCYFRMPTLVPSDVDQLVSVFLSEQTRQSVIRRLETAEKKQANAAKMARLVLTAPRNDAPHEVNNGLSPADSESDSVEDELIEANEELRRLAIDNEVNPLEVVDAGVYSREDELALREVLNKYFGSNERENASPRSIRSWLFKFQLARLLLRVMNKVDTPPETLAKTLMHAYREQIEGRSLPDGPLNSIKRIVESVA